MYADSITVKGKDSSGNRIVKVGICANSIPATFPTTGANIIGLEDTDVLAPMSYIFVPNGGSVYIADEDMNWRAQ